ncbi:MAG: altronate dehydratase family protein [Kiritimatiellae bacterium]|jgi:altronate hydrolase|nr:altronate dehydratase family protein [Kiritimatiellia bacterium]
MKQYIKINPKDSVAVALTDLAKNQILEEFDVTTQEEIKQGHKVALQDTSEGEKVIKYGNPIGYATQNIAKGQWIHTHNIKTTLSGVEEYEYVPNFSPVKYKDDQKMFMGYRRSNGEIGIRNEIWIIPLVGCVNKTAEILAKDFSEYIDDNIDDIIAFPHPFGCSQLGDDHLHTQQILAGLAQHPNAGSVLLIGLGCENNHMEAFKKVLGKFDADRVKTMITQECRNELEEGRRLMQELIMHASLAEREPCSVAKLKIGLKCGGSDGLSGITANPLVGVFSDMLIANGGTSVLSEVPEMFGAEKLLMERCLTKEIFNDCVDMVNNFKKYFMKYDQPVYENPSPGNKEGGISTLEDKSLGCTQKGGSSPVVDVLAYGDRLHKNGLNLMTGPGNDMVATTVLAAAGVHAVLFTTGRGTPFGGPVPTVKISTNSQLADKKSNWIDFNAGTLVENTSMKRLATDFFDYIIDMASGNTKTKNELNGYKEISIFKDGVTL